jgi:predicted TIM-barrel fold metal-dependent hydrolase
MKIIDFHTHAFPDKLAERALTAIAHPDWPAYLGGKVSDLIASMDRNGIDVSVVCPIATKPEQVEGIFRWCEQIRSRRIEPFASVHPEGADAISWLEKIAAAGIKGIKLHPMYQEFEVDRPRMIEIYSACASLGLMVLLHCGQDLSWPPEDDRVTPERIATALSAVPDATFITSHMGGWRMWDAAERFLIGKHCWMETSFSLSELPPQRAVDMMRRHGIDRVIFGTDSPWADQAVEISRLKALPLTPQEQEKILYSNAAKLLRL